MTSTHRWRSVALGLAASLSIAAASEARAQETVNYGVQPATAPVYIAKALGLLEAIEKKHNIKFAFRLFTSGAPEN